MPIKKSTTKKVKTEDISPLLTLAEQQALNAEIRLDNLQRKKQGQTYGKSFTVVDMKKGSKHLDPNVLGLGDRSKETIHQISVQDRIQGAYDLFKNCTPLETRAKDPFTWKDRDREQASFDRVTRLMQRDGLNSEDLPEIQRKVRKKIEQEKDYLNSYYGHYGTILPEYDQYEPYTMLDTEAYLMRAIKRQHSLMFRQGFKIQGESHRFTRYINARLNQIGFVMGMTVESFLKDILENLLIISNCFLLKIRDDNGCSGGISNKKNDDRIPVAAYMILPPHSIFPFVNQRGEIIKWRRYYGSARKYKDYKLEDVIHFKWDVKPGHVYGTPRTVSVRDDIFALRRLEENVEMLLINHLFPLFHVKVGTKEAPAQMLVDGITEVDLIKAELENMPKEGVFVTDERVEVDVVGINGEAPDPEDIMTHYKARIFTGLGVSSIDMGETDTGNRATAENVSQNLKDQVKSDLNWFCGQFKHYIVQEMFEESNEPLSVQRAILDVNLVFPDVDVDGHIKWENHVIEKFNNHLITENEARRQTGMIPFNKQQAKMTHYELHVKDLQQEGIKLKNKGMIEAMAVRGEVAAGGSDPEGKSKKIKVSKSSSSAASVTNKNRPANQHGSNMDPHSARSSMDPNLIYDLLEQEMDRLQAEGKLNSAGWYKASGVVIDKYVETCMREAPQDYYTNQEQMEIESFRQLAKDRVAQTTDLDIISVLLNDLVDQYFEEPDAEEFTENSRTEDEPVERELGSSTD